MRKRLNIKLLVSLVAGSFLFMMSVYVVHGFQVKRNARTLLERAERHRAEGDLNETLRIMRRYLAHKPEDSEQFKVAARDAINQLYGMVERREEVEKPQLDLAVFLIEEAVRKNGEDLAMRREAADFWAKMGRFDYAIDNLEPIENDWTADDRLLYVTALQRTGKDSLAIKELQEILGLDPETGEFSKDDAQYPDLLNAYSSLVQLLVRRSLDLVQAEKTANQLVNANENNYEAFLLRAQLLPFIKGEDGRQQSYEDIRRAYEMEPDSVETLLAMANMYMEEGDVVQAREFVDRGMAKAETRRDKSRLFNLLVNVAIRDKDLEEAASVIEEGLDAVPYDADLLWMKARLLLDQKKHAEVVALQRDLKRAKLSVSMIEYLQARIMMDNGDYLAATKRLAKIRSTVSPMIQYEIDAYLSSGYAKTSQLDLRLATVKRMIEARPNDLTAHESYVVTLDLLNRSQEALSYLQNLIVQLERDGKPVPPSLKSIETSLDMKVTFGSAITDVDAADVDRIKKSVTQVWRNEEIPELRRRALVVDLFRKLDRPDDARKWIREGLEKDRSSFGLWALALDFAQDADEARGTLADMEKVFAAEHDLEMRSMRARLAVKYDPASAQEVIGQQQENVDHFSNDELASLYYELGSLQLALRNRNEGLRLLELASEKAPKRLDIVTAIFDEAKRGTDAKKLEELVERIGEITTRDDDTYRMAEAGRIVWMLNRGLVPENRVKSMLGRARQIVQTIRTNRPEWLPAIIEESSIHRFSDDAEAALESLKVAHELQPTNAQIIRLIAQSYKDAGQSELARQWMNQLPLSMRNENDNRAALSLLWERRNSWSQTDLKNAMTFLESVAPMSSENAMDLVWRSQIMLKAGRLVEAEAAAFRAKELEQGLSEVWTNLVSVLKVQGKDAEVTAELQEAAIELPETIKPVVLGRCYAILGNQNLAQNYFNNALRSDPNNASVKRLMAESLLLERNVAKAKEFIDDILNNADPVEHAQELSWARRRLAVLLAETNVYASFHRALELIEENKVDGELQGDDLAIWLSLCARRPEKQSWERALLELEAIEKNRRLSSIEQFLKASLLEQYGDTHWDQVHQIMSQLLAGGGGTRQRVETWVTWLLERGHVQEAKTWAANNLDPNSITKVTIDVHDLAQRGHFADAKKRLATRTPAQVTTTQELAALLAVANIAEGVGKYDKSFYEYAEQQYEKILSVAPSQVLLWARALGVNNDEVPKIEKALALCVNAHKRKVPLSASASVIVAILRDKQDRLKSDLAPFLPQLSSWFDQAMQASSGDDLALRWQVAFYFDLISDFERAEKEYQAIIDSPQVSPFDRGVAMNNLAYVMALDGKLDQPLRLINAAADLLGPTGDVIDTRGYIHFVRGEMDQAIEDFQEAIRAGLNVGPKHFHLAMVHDKRDSASDAENAWKQALAVGVTKLTIHPHLHDEYDKLSRKFGGTPVAANF